MLEIAGAEGAGATGESVAALTLAEAVVEHDSAGVATAADSLLAGVLGALAASGSEIVEGGEDIFDWIRSYLC